MVLNFDRQEHRPTSASTGASLGAWSFAFIRKLKPPSKAARNRPSITGGMPRVSLRRPSARPIHTIRTHPAHRMTVVRAGSSARRQTRVRGLSSRMAGDKRCGCYRLACVASGSDCSRERYCSEQRDEALRGPCHHCYRSMLSVRAALCHGIVEPRAQRRERDGIRAALSHPPASSRLHLARLQAALGGRGKA